MHGDTPPRVPEIEDDVGEGVQFDNVIGDDDELDMEEVTLEELEARFAAIDEYGDDDEEVEEEDIDEARYRSPVPDDAELTFKNHSAPVFACCLHPQRDLAATGGEDDRVFLWNIETGEMLHEITKHMDTVIEVHFSHDGTYLATGDMSGALMVHKLQDSTDGSSDPGSVLREIWQFSMGDMVWMRWHRSGNILLAGSESGEVYIWRIPSGDCKILPGVGERCEAGELSNDGKKLFTSYSNGVIKLWDLKNCTTIMEVDHEHPMALTELSTTVSCDKESPLYMAGSQDGKIIFCTNTGPVAVVEAGDSVECVAFSPSSELKVAASGTLHGQIAIWDFAKYSLRTICEHPETDDGITRLKWINDFTLVVATIQGNIYGYDARSGLRIFTLAGHIADVYEFCYDPQRHILLSVSEDNRAKIFKVPQLGD